MRFEAKILIIALALSAGTVFAKEGVQDPTVKARMELMDVLGANTRVLGEMAGGKAPFDATAAAAAKAALAAAAAQVPAAFETEADDPVSEARPDIWTNMEGFVEKAEALKTAAEAIDTSSQAGLQAGMGSIGSSCKSCHGDFRAKK